MVDAVLGDDPHPLLTGNWRADLTAFAGQQRILLRRHPWLGSQRTGRPTLGPTRSTTTSSRSARRPR